MKTPALFSLKAAPMLAAAIAALLASPAAQAATRTWNGNTDATWDTPANWNEGALGTGNTPVFGAAGSSGTLLNNNTTAGISVAGITFNSGAAAFVIGDGTTAANAGSSFVLTGTIANNSSSVQTLNTPFSMTAARTFTTTTGGGDLTLGGNISGTGGAITKTGPGTLTLSGTNSYTGGTVVNAGTLKVDAGVGGKLYDGQTAGALTLGTASGGRGTFIYDNTTAADATALGLGALTLVAGQGDNTVQLTRTALHPTSLTFTSINSVSYPVVNFVIAGTPGTIGTDSRIDFSSHVSGRITDSYTFFNGGDFAWYESAGYIRAPKYDGTVPEGSTSAGGTSISMATHQQLTGSLSAQNTATPTTLKINGAHDITMATGQTLSFTADKGALLKTGGGTSTIYGGFSMSVQGSEIIRTDTADDVLVIDSGINSNSSKTRLLKSGEGTLILKGTNQWGNLISGSDPAVATLYINGGVVEVAGSGVIQNTANKLQLNIASGALFRFNSSGNQLINRAISGDGSVAMTGTGTLTLSSSNSYSGGTTVSGGILTFLNTSAKTGSTTVAAGATLGLGVGGTGFFDLRQRRLVVRRHPCRGDHGCRRQRRARHHQWRLHLRHQPKRGAGAGQTRRQHPDPHRH